MLYTLWSMSISSYCAWQFLHLMLRWFWRVVLCCIHLFYHLLWHSFSRFQQHLEYCHFEICKVFSVDYCKTPVSPHTSLGNLNITIPCKILFLFTDITAILNCCSPEDAELILTDSLWLYLTAPQEMLNLNIVRGGKNWNWPLQCRCMGYDAWCYM